MIEFSLSYTASCMPYHFDTFLWSYFHRSVRNQNQLSDICSLNKLEDHCTIYVAYLWKHRCARFWGAIEEMVDIWGKRVDAVFCFGATPNNAHGYSWLCTQESLPVVLGVLEIIHKSTTYKIWILGPCYSPHHHSSSPYTPPISQVPIVSKN